MPLVQQDARFDPGPVFQVFEFKDLCGSGTAHANALALAQTACLNPLSFFGLFLRAGFKVASSPVLAELSSASVTPLVTPFIRLPYLSGELACSILI